MSIAYGHARHKESTPAKGEVLAASPSQVVITFTQEVQKVSGSYGIEVFRDAGGRGGIRNELVSAGEAVLSDADRSMMSVALQPNLPPGRYIVQYRNVSDADGDPYAAGFAFYVGVEPTAEQLAADALLAPEEGAETPQATEPASTPEPGRTPAASATASAPNDDDHDGNGSTTWIVLGAIVAVGIVAGFIGARLVTRRRA